jgi:two-component system NarL family sensor kinase
MDQTTDIYILSIGATILLLALLATIVSLLFIYQNRQIKSQLAMKQAKVHYEQELLKTQLEIREQTLKHISEEIHDNVGQILSLANLGLTSLDLKPENPIKHKVDNVMDLISKSITDLRNLSKTLDPQNIVNASLRECLQFELKLLQRVGSYQTHLEVVGQEQPMDSPRQLVVYRIVQESIQNTIKHAKASRVDIQVEYTERLLKVTIQDDGIGFDADTQINQGAFAIGSGLRNIKSRAKLIGGEVMFTSASPRGTCVNLVVPLSAI